jgi:hypothetical protein
VPVRPGTGRGGIAHRASVRGSRARCLRGGGLSLSSSSGSRSISTPTSPWRPISPAGVWVLCGCPHCSVGRQRRASAAAPAASNFPGSFAAWAAALSMLAAVLVGVARGRAWELLVPPMEHIELGSTGLSIDLPRVAARGPRERRERRVQVWIRSALSRALGADRSRADDPGFRSGRLPGRRDRR